MVVTPQEDKTRRSLSRKLEKHFARSQGGRYYRILRNQQRASLRSNAGGEHDAPPENDVTHVFNEAAMQSISAAIEDLASEVGQGEILATFQTMDAFKEQRLRYVSLAKRLNAVRIWGEGIPPKNCPKIDFVPTFHHELNRYRMICFASDAHSAVLVCKQVNQEKEPGKRLYMGFYSFNPFLVQSIRRSFLLMSCGLDSIIRLWEREHHMPVLSQRELGRFFKEPVIKRRAALVA